MTDPRQLVRIAAALTCIEKGDEDLARRLLRVVAQRYRRATR